MVITTLEEACIISLTVGIRIYDSGEGLVRWAPSSGATGEVKKRRQFGSEMACFCLFIVVVCPSNI